MAEAKPRTVLFDLSGVFDIESSVLKMLEEADKRHLGGGVTLCLAGLAPEVYELVKRSPLGAALGRERLLFDVKRGVDAFLRKEAGEAQQFTFASR